jgi:hypothetical protein
VGFDGEFCDLLDVEEFCFWEWMEAPGIFCIKIFMKNIFQNGGAWYFIFFIRISKEWNYLEKSKM